ncbi:hypothetical protein VA7868_01901 [Vibrio aerogenes CECT 7868]|uniref:Uncharacterized protein n=2 Tax=Vibrio aerogenes TaxID=92172 RepID=A0A1M5YQ07_9VIBR|nr:hypothetical protein VA7868_01901 [Vibrio aerogenes CECT 7868]
MAIGIAGIIMAAVCGVAGLLISLLVVNIIRRPATDPLYDKTVIVVVSTLAAGVIGGIGGVVVVARLFMS